MTEKTLLRPPAPRRRLGWLALFLLLLLGLWTISLMVKEEPDHEGPGEITFIRVNPQPMGGAQELSEEVVRTWPPSVIQALHSANQTGQATAHMSAAEASQLSERLPQKDPNQAKALFRYRSVVFEYQFVWVLN